MLRILRILLLGALVLPQLARGITARTLAFELPAEKVDIDLKLEKSTAPIRLAAAINQFGTSTKLGPGAYVAESPSFKGPASFTIPEGASESYLLLVFARQDGALCILPVADEPTKFGAGDRYVINATAEEIAVRIHQTKILLKPGKSSYFKTPAPPVPGNRIEVEMHRHAGERWLAFNSTYWPLSAETRSIVLIYPAGPAGTPRVRSLTDFPAAPADTSR